jgi:hypothetical protein
MKVLLRRDVAPQWWTQDWPVIVAAAETPTDGVEFSRGAYRENGLAVNDDTRHGWACMRQGDAPRTHRAFLFRQNW